MSKSLGTLTIDLVAKTGGFVQGMSKAEKEAQRSSKNIKKQNEELAASWGKVRNAAVAAIASFGVGSVFNSVITNTQKMEKEQAQLAAVLRSTGEAAGFNRDQLNGMAAALEGRSMFSAGDINQAQTALLAFTGIMGDNFVKAQQAAADMAARTGMDIKSTAELIGRALDVPSKGMAVLSRQGFRFSDDQKALMEQLESTGKTAEAQGIILKALEESYSGAAQAARNTFGGAIEGIKNTLSGLMTGQDGSLEGARLAVEGLNAALGSPEAKAAFNSLVSTIVNGTTTVVNAISAIPFEYIDDALLVTAAIVAGRMTPAIIASGQSMAFATIESVRYQFALGKMAGHSAVATTAIIAQTTAVRALSGAMALIGGPIGLAVTIGLAATAMVMGNAKTRADELNDALGRLKKRNEDLSSESSLLAQLEQEKDAISKLQSLIKNDLEPTIVSLSNAQAGASDSVKAGFQSAIAGVTQRINEANKAIDGHKEKIKSIGDALGDYGKQLQSDQVISKKYLELNDQLEKQIALVGKVSGAEKLRAQIESGAIQGLVAGEAELLIAKQKRLDMEQELYDNARKAVDIEKSLQTEEEKIKASYEERRAIILASSAHTEEEKGVLIARLNEETNKKLLSATGSYWQKWLESARNALMNFDQLSKTVIDNFTSGFGNAFESIVLDSTSAEDAFKKMTEGMLRSIVNAIGQMIAQWIAYQAVQLLTGKTTQASAATAMTANAAAMSVQAGLNAFAATAAIPIVGPAAAPAAMATAVGVTAPMAASVASLSWAGMAHDGIDSVPEDGTWLLQKGERVVTSETSAKLDATLEQIKQNGNGGGQGVVVNLNNAPQGTEVQQSTDAMGRTIIDVLIADVNTGGRFMKTLTSRTNVQRRGS